MSEGVGHVRALRSHDPLDIGPFEIEARFRGVKLLIVS